MINNLQKYKYWLAGGIALVIILVIQFSRSSPILLKPPVLVKVSSIQRGDRIEKLQLIGTVVAPESVSIRSRLDSQIVKLYITHGQSVKKGDKLVQLDDRALVAQLAQTKANLESNKAELIRAEKKYERDTELAKRGVAAKETLDQSTQAYLAAKAALEATQAQITNLETQIDYADIRSPIDGIAGTISITEGNLVRANDTTSIVVINKTDPIYVDMPLPQRYYEAIKNDPKSLNIVIKSSELSSPKKSKGAIIDNTVDTSARTLNLRTEVDNKNRDLWPGMFVDVTLDLKTHKDVLSIPLKSIMYTQKDKQVYVVSEDGTAQLKSVNPIFTTETEAIVEADLKEGDKIITDGGFNVKPDGKVKISEDSGS